MRGIGEFTVIRQTEHDADKCRRMGWTAGTRLVGDEGYGPTVIEITAVGEEAILAKTISHNGEPKSGQSENMWTLACRDWSALPLKEPSDV